MLEFEYYSYFDQLGYMMKTLLSGNRFTRLFIKMTACFAAFLLLIQPIGIVFAEDITPTDSTPDTTIPDDQTTTDPIEPPPEDTTPPPETTDTMPPDTIPPEDTTPPDDSQIMSPQGQSATGASTTIQDAKTRLTPEVDNLTGALIYNYPLTLPPGRNNLTPQLSLRYNSQNTQNDSVVGYGWNLSLPYISRINKSGSNNLYNATSTAFTTSDQGELAQVSSGVFGLRSDDGSFSKYTLASNVWTVTTKSGTTYTYGTAAFSRQDDPSDSTHIYKWMLDKVTDANGNYISYTYYKNQGQIYPDTITYTNTTGGSGIFSVTFARESVPTPFKNYMGGFAVTTAYRINTITASVSSVTRSSYALTYTTGDNSGHSLVHIITNTSYDSLGSPVTVGPTTLTYQTIQKSFNLQSITMPTHTVVGGHQDSRLGIDGDFSGNPQPPQRGGYVIDVNGDGLLDWIESTNTGGIPPNNEYYGVWLGTGTGWVKNSTWSAAMPHGSSQTYFIDISGISHTIVTDVNGDGLPDWVVSTPGSSITSDVHAVWLNNGAGWTKSTTWTMPTMTIGTTTYGIAMGYNRQITPDYFDYYTSLIDINNDGLVDLVQGSGDNFGTTPSSPYYSVWINSGSGWTKSTTWTMPIHQNTDGTYFGQASNGQIIDVNGDGLPDWVETAYITGSTETYDVWMNSGTAWVRNTSWVMPVHSTASSNSSVTLGVPLFDTVITCSGNPCGYRNGTLADINGDGLPDLVETINNNDANTNGEYDTAWINTGKGWTRDATWGMPPWQFGQTAPALLGDRSTLTDINNDGLPDWFWADGVHEYMFINTGVGWSVQSTWTFPTHSSDGYSPNLTLGRQDYVQTMGVNIFRNNELHDINNDGLPDVIESTNFDDPPSSGQYPYEHYATWTNGGTTSDLLASITYPYGGSSTFSYGEQTILDKNPYSGTQSIMALTNIATSDAFGTTSTTTYTYSGGKFFYSTSPSLPARKFTGFHTVTAHLPNGSLQTTYFHQGDTTDTGTYEYDDHESKIGRAYRTDLTNASGNLYTRTTTKLEHTLLTSTNNDRYFVYPSQVVSETFDGNGSEKATAETFAFDTATGNITTDTTLGEVTATTPLAYTDVGSDLFTTTYQYATSSAGVSKVSIEITTNQSSATVRDTRHFYDTLALGSISLGNETKVRKLKSGSSYAVTQKSYNSYGLVLTATDENSKVTNYAYDSFNLYPATVTDPLTHAAQYLYDYSCGLPTQTTNPNTSLSLSVYDGLCRVITEKESDQVTPSTLLTETSYEYIDEINHARVHTLHYLDASNLFDSYTYMDGLGRVIQESKEAEPHNPQYWFSDYNKTDHVYDSAGNLWKESLPYKVTTSDYGGPTSDANLLTTSTYDPLGRVLTSANILGSTSYAYDDWKTTITDPNSKVKNYYKDAYGNLVKVEEINSGSTYTTLYEWDGNQKLTKITDALGNVRNFTYDNLGRRLTAEDLHGTSDSTFGSWSYAYDDAGNLTQSTSPLNAVVNYTYDDVGRVLTEDYTGATGTEVTYTYDSCTYGTGSLCIAAVTGSGSTSYTYTPLSAVASESRTITGQGSAFVTSYTYDRQGNLLNITYPDTSQVRYTYNTFGQLGSIDQKESGGSFTPVISGIAYSPMLQTASLTYANGVVTTNTYDNTKLYRLSHKVTQNTGGSKLQDITYTYDPVGNITNIVDASNTNASKSVAYTYDDLARLTQATATNTGNGQNYTETYTYNALGNLLTKNGQTYLYQGNTSNALYKYANPHATTSVNGVTVSYDKSGNVTADGTATNTWDYKNQMTQNVIGTTTVSYLYDENGNRVKYTVGTANTFYPNKFYDKKGTTLTRHIYLADQPIATYENKNGTLNSYYIHNDHLGSTGVVSNTAGTSQETLDYYPFGDIRLNIKAGGFEEKTKFTRHLIDSDTNFTYLGKRYDNQKWGRFLSQDSDFLSVGSSNKQLDVLLTDPQKFNSYSYVGNNPLRRIDPDGKTGFDVVNGAGIGLLMGLGDLTIGTLYAVSHPAQTIQNLPNLPGAIVQSFKQNGEMIANGNDFQRGYGITSGLAVIGSILAPESRIGKGAGLLDSALVCRGGACTAESLLRGSNEYKAGLNPSTTTPLTGISVNAGNVSKAQLIKYLPGKYNKAGFTFEDLIENLGGKLISDPKPGNPYHSLIDGLNVNQITEILKVENIK